LFEQLANLFRIPELRRRILFTAMMLAVYRVGGHVPTPGIDAQALAGFFEAQKGSILDFFDMFSGGALQRMTVFSLGIMPYISASIILQLMTAVVPYLEQLKKQGGAGQRKITQYTRYGTVVLAGIQGMGIAFGLESMTSPTGALVIPHPGWPFRLLVMVTLVAGTAFIMWLGEQITEHGVGNGISLIIFAGIVANLIPAAINSSRLLQSGAISIFVAAAVAVLMTVVIGLVIFLETSFRKIPVHYAKRNVGSRTYGGQSTHIPLKINTSGVIPPIFASSIMLFPTTIAQFVNTSDLPWLQSALDSLNPGGVLYNAVYVGLILFFAFFYTAITFNPADLADNMKKHGGFIPGIRPGAKTAEFVDFVLTRITFAGALYLAAVCVLPTLLINTLNVPFFFGGTALLIVVGVGLDTVQQVESHLLQHNYDGFLKKGAIRGRR
jgi:preprotein translocase subunit SecY